MNTLSAEILGKIFTYLPLKEVAAFELLNRQCGEAITLHGIYFCRPFIVVNLKVNVPDELTFEITFDGHHRVAIFMVFPDGRIENKNRNSKISVPESREDQSSSLQAIFQWIKWNSTMLQSKWGKRSDTTSIIQHLVIDYLDIHFWSTISQRRLIDGLKCEQCSIELLQIVESVSLKPGQFEKASQFALLLHRSGVIQKLLIWSHIPIKNLIPLAIEYVDGVSIDIGTLMAADLLNFVTEIKNTWISKRQECNQRPWILKVEFSLFYVSYETSDFETLFIHTVDTDFSIVVEKDVNVSEFFRAEIKAMQSR